MTAVSASGALASVLVLLGVLVWTFGLALALLSKILASSDRAVRVKARPLPWPRVEIDVSAKPTEESAGGDGVGVERGLRGADVA
ncbi:MAG: hypothetical protein ACRDQ5_02255 [Sciscionella sp.]